MENLRYKLGLAKKLKFLNRVDKTRVLQRDIVPT